MSEEEKSEKPKRFRKGLNEEQEGEVTSEKPREVPPDEESDE